MSSFKFSNNVTFVEDLDGTYESAFLGNGPGYFGRPYNAPRNIIIWMSWEKGEPKFKEMWSGNQFGLDMFLEQNKGVKEPDRVTVYYKTIGMEDGWKSI